MGSFAITYDDFSGGHYMGDKSASTPSNTWYGQNAVLNPKGELVPGAVGQVDTYTRVGATSGTVVDSFIANNTIYTVTSWIDSLGSTYGDLRVTPYLGTSSTVYLTGAPNGKCVPDFGSGASGARLMYYIDGSVSPRNLRKYNFDTSTDSSVAALPSGVAGNDLVQYGSRLVTWASNTLYYTDNTISSWSATDYYTYSGKILNVIPRSNDLVVITDNGVFSTTGVLGSSVSIQLITPQIELLSGMVYAKASGRTIFFPSTDGRIYQLIGASTQEIARFNLGDLNKSVSFTNAQPPEQIMFGLVEGGNILAALTNGTWFVQQGDNGWVRMYDEPTATSTRGEGVVAKPVGSQYSQNTISAIAQAEYNNSGSNWEVNIYAARHKTNWPSPAIDQSLNGTPATATVELSEYWHQRPFVVRELIVDAVYDDYQGYPSELQGNASVTASIIPTGAIDYTVNQTSALTSTAQTYTTALADVNADNSRVLHRFRTDNAIKAYGFYPKITWQACRIRRVIAVCED